MDNGELSHRWTGGPDLTPFMTGCYFLKFLLACAGIV